MLELFVKRRFTIISVSLALALLTKITAARAQQDSQDFVSQKFTHFTLSVDDCKLVQHQFLLKVPNDSFAKLRFLENEVIQRELEIVPNQSKDLKRLLDEIRRESEKMQEVSFNTLVSRGDIESDLPEEASPSLAKINKSIDDIFQSVLLEHQRKRLAELNLRFLVREQGLLFAIRNSDLSKSLKLSDSQRQQIAINGRELAKELLSSSERLKESAFEKLLSILDSDQRKKLDEIVNEFGGIKIPPLDVLALQIEELEWIDDLFESAPKVDFVGCFVQPYFEIDVDGSFRLVDTPGNLSTNSRSTKESELVSQREWTTFMATVSGITDSRLVEYLSLSPANLETLTQYQADLSAQTTKLRTPPQEAFEDPRLMKSWLEEHVSIRSKFIRENAFIFNTMFDSSQKTKLKNLAANNELIRFGFVYLITQGALGKLLNVSNEQKTESRRVGFDVLAMISKESLKLESAAISRLKDRLNSSQKEVLDDAIGEDLEHSRPNIELFAMQLLNN